MATPCYGGMCTVGYVRSMLDIQRACYEQIAVDFLVTEGESLVTRARNNSVKTFLESDCDTLAFIDADIEMSGDDFVALAMDEGVRGAAVCMKTRDGSELLSCWRKGEPVKRAEMPSEPFRVTYLGAAVMFIDRSVFEALIESEAVSAYEDAGIGPGYEFFPTGVVGGVLLSEDYYFCHILRQQGVPITCHPGIQVRHYGQAHWMA